MQQVTRFSIRRRTSKQENAPRRGHRMVSGHRSLSLRGFLLSRYLPFWDLCMIHILFRPRVFSLQPCNQFLEVLLPSVNSSEGFFKIAGNSYCPILFPLLSSVLSPVTINRGFFAPSTQVALNKYLLNRVFKGMWCLHYSVTVFYSTFCLCGFTVLWA